MEEGVVDIKLLNRPVIDRGKSKNNPNSSHFDNWGKCFKVINTFNLRETLCNEMSFIMFHRSIRFALDFINLFAADGFYIWGSVHKKPKFCSVPKPVSQCLWHASSEYENGLFVACRFKFNRKGHEVTTVWLGEAVVGENKTKRMRSRRRWRFEQIERRIATVIS